MEEVQERINTLLLWLCTRTCVLCPGGLFQFFFLKSEFVLLAVFVKDVDLRSLDSELHASIYGQVELLIPASLLSAEGVHDVASVNSKKREDAFLLHVGSVAIIHCAHRVGMPFGTLVNQDACVPFRVLDFFSRAKTRNEREEGEQGEAFHGGRIISQCYPPKNLHLKIENTIRLVLDVFSMTEHESRYLRNELLGELEDTRPVLARLSAEVMIKVNNIRAVADWLEDQALKKPSPADFAPGGDVRSATIRTDGKYRSAMDFNEIVNDIDGLTKVRRKVSGLELRYRNFTG